MDGWEPIEDESWKRPHQAIKEQINSPPEWFQITIESMTGNILRQTGVMTNARLATLETQLPRKHASTTEG